MLFYAVKHDRTSGFTAIGPHWSVTITKFAALADPTLPFPGMLQFEHLDANGRPCFVCTNPWVVARGANWDVGLADYGTMSFEE